MKKLLCLVVAVVVTLSLSACSKDDDSTSVKIPDNANSKASMTYEEAIVPFESDEQFVQLHDRANMILMHLQCINAFYHDVLWTYDLEEGGCITAEDGITDSMNALEEYFKSEQQYTEYVQKLSNPVIKDSYLKFISLAEETYQAFVDNPTKSVTDEINYTTITTLEQYSSNIPMTVTVPRPEYYLSYYTRSLFNNLSFIEAYCMLTPETILNTLMSSNELFARDLRMQRVTISCSSIDYEMSAEGLDLDYIISTLDTLMGLKDNAYAIAVEAYGSDSQKLDAYNEFMETVTKLYNTVRVNRPEFNDTEYIEKHDFYLDPLEKLMD